MFVFVFVQSVSNEYCTIWSVCAASHLTLRDSEWRVNLGPACRCHTWTSPCLPSTWEPLFVFAFCIYFQFTFWKADHGRKFDDDGKHGNNVWMPCKGELFDQSEAWSTVRKRPLKTLWIVMVISSWGRWWKKIDIYEDDYLWRLLLFRKGLIKMDRNRNAIIFQMQGVMDIGHGIILNLKLQVCLRTTPPFPTTPSLHHHVSLQHVWRCLQVWISINTDPDAL